MSKIAVEYVDSMGSDDSVVGAARVSFSKRAEKYTAEENSSLIRFLAREGHDIPFAHTALTLRVMAPIPIRTQCFKSKVGFAESEESRRYITTEPRVYIPEYFREKADNVKQGSGGAHPNSEIWIRDYENRAREAIATYSDMIRGGVCPEQARFVLPQGVMVNWIWTGSLLAYARFYRLRTHTTAQEEVRRVADKVGVVCSDIWPVSWAALTEGIVQ